VGGSDIVTQLHGCKGRREEYEGFLFVSRLEQERGKLDGGVIGSVEIGVNVLLKWPNSNFEQIAEAIQNPGIVDD
jgi:hypothetical protein